MVFALVLTSRSVSGQIRSDEPSGTAMVKPAEICHAYRSFLRPGVGNGGPIIGLDADVGPL